MFKKVVFLAIFFLISSQVIFASSVPSIITFNNQSKSRAYTDMPPPIFPHALHEKKIKCSKCHPKPFIKKIGANKVNMKENIEGNFCGKCHDAIISFGMIKCALCHKKT